MTLIKKDHLPLTVMVNESIESDRLSAHYKPHFIIKQSLLLLAIGFFFLGCKKETASQANNSELKGGIRYPVSFKTTDFMSTTEQMALNKITQSTKTSLALKNQVYFLSYYLTRPDKPNVIIKKINQKSTDVGFGTIIDTLQAGSYRVYIIGGTRAGYDLVPLAFSGESPANRHLYITFDKEKTYLRPDSIGDMFFKKLDVSLPGQTVHAVTLSRIVGKIKVIIKDPIPASVSRIEVTFENPPTAYDVFTGKPYDARSFVTLNHFIMPEDVGKKNLTFGITSWENALGIFVTVFDFKNRYAFVKEIDPVNLKANTMITYLGNVFTDLQGFQIQADTTWNSKVILPFPGQ